MHVALLCSPVPGHLNPMLAVGQALQARGHRATVYTIADAMPLVEAAGVTARAIGAVHFPRGSFLARWGRVGEGPGLPAQLQLLHTHRLLTEAMCEDVPALAAADAVDAMVVDHLQPQGASLAEHLGVPFATLCTTLPLERAAWGAVPSGLRLEHSVVGRAMEPALLRALAAPLMAIVNRYRGRWGLTGRHTPGQTHSRRLRLHVFPASLEDVAPRAPPSMDVGPLRPARAVDFPWERLDGRPIAYVSLGTIRNRSPSVFLRLVQAVEQLGGELQPVVATGAWHGGPRLELTSRPGTVVVDYAPQWELLERAALCVTHAGAGTTLDCFAAGVPTLAVPCADDQPANAALIASRGLGVAVSWHSSPAALARALAAVARTEAHREVGARWRASLAALGGAPAAAAALEHALGALTATSGRSAGFALEPSPSRR